MKACNAWKSWILLSLAKPVGKALVDLSRFRRLGDTRIRKPGSTPFRLLVKLPLIAGTTTVLLANAALATSPNYVQSKYAVPQEMQHTVTETYTAAQAAGNLNVVIVGWNDATAQVSSLKDSNGNVYQLAVGPTVLTGGAPLSQAIYYAKNISPAMAGANTITVRVNVPATKPNVSVLEYNRLYTASPLGPRPAPPGAT